MNFLAGCPRKKRVRRAIGVRGWSWTGQRWKWNSDNRVRIFQPEVSPAKNLPARVLPLSHLMKNKEIPRPRAVLIAFQTSFERRGSPVPRRDEARYKEMNCGLLASENPRRRITRRAFHFFPRRNYFYISPLRLHICRLYTSVIIKFIRLNVELLDY